MSRKSLMIFAAVCLLVLAMAGLVTATTLVAPSQLAVKRFHAHSIATAAKINQAFLADMGSNTAWNANGLAVLDTGYADGCYLNHNDAGFTVASWYKACYGKRTVLVGTRQSADVIKPTVGRILGVAYTSALDDAAAAGPCRPVIDDYGTDFYRPGDTRQSRVILQLQRIDVSGPGCKQVMVSQTGSSLTPLDPTIYYSSLTRAANTASVMAKAKAAGYTSLIVASYESQYFNKDIPGYYKVLPLVTK